MHSLTPQQFKAIEKIQGPCVILAGAGTGKTLTIAEKIKYLIKNKIYPAEKIVCITFSNEAANNLSSKIRNLQELEKEPIVKTFHAFSSDLLKKYGKKINIPENFKILDPDQAKVLLHINFKLPPQLCHNYISTIGTAKDLGIKIEDLEKNIQKKQEAFKNIDIEKKLEFLQFELQTLHLKQSSADKIEIKKEISKISNLVKIKKFVTSWKAYEKLKQKQSYQDYSDLNNNALLLLKQFPDVAKDYDYVIVDEFQDTNKVQLDLLISLALNKNVTIVGDLNQSIYRFRGAYKENFNEFKKTFNVKQSDIFNLDKSYRSSNKILKTAHQLIINNYENKNDCFQVFNHQNKEGPDIEIYELLNAKEEARKVVEIIKEQISQNVPEEEICVMCRTHQQARIIKNLLEANQIPFCAVNKGSLIKEKQIKIAIDYLAILENLKNKKHGCEHAWWDLIYQLNFPEEDIIKIGKFIKENKNSENISSLILNKISELKLTENGKTAAGNLAERINRLLPLTKKPIEELVADIYNISGILNQAKEQIHKRLNLNKFYELAKEHRALHDADLAGFVHYLEVLSSLNIEIPEPDLEKKGVRLMTSHAAKGLEYQTVIITNLAEKRFPMIKSSSNPLLPLELNPELNQFSELTNEELEYITDEYEKKHQLFDERRLCYVSFTRAKEKLFLTYAKLYSGKKHAPSQFLDEIKYKNNQEISFHVDNTEKYEEPKQQITIDKKPEIEEKTVFSPTSLLLFDKCGKKYEYKYIFNMPEQKTVSWEAMQLGSFVHHVLEKGVKCSYNSLKQFLDLAKDLHSDVNWESTDLTEAEHLIKVFFERHKAKFSEKSKTEQHLPLEINGIKFTGFADRIDFNSDGIEIIDYKTGKSAIPPKERNWQLGYYALAAAKFGKVKRINLETLREDYPLEFQLDDKGNAYPINSTKLSGFNIYEVEQDLISTAKKIMQAYKSGFKPCPIDKNCDFCNEYVYNH